MERILGHSNLSLWIGSLPESTHTGWLRNPLCGDEVWVQLIVKGNAIHQARFHGRGCVISQACASMLCEGIENQTISYVLNTPVEELLDFQFHQFSIHKQQCVLVGYKALMQALQQPLPTKPQE